MKATGFMKHLDPSGRIHVPKEIAAKLGFEIGDAFEVLTGPNEIIFRKFAPDCSFCGGEVDMDGIAFNDCAVCASCAKKFVGAWKAEGSNEF